MANSTSNSPGVFRGNARLASQVTGWKIDIKDETTAYKEGLKFKPNVTVK